MKWRSFDLNAIEPLFGVTFSVRLLNRLIGAVVLELQSRIEALGEALLDFSFERLFEKVSLPDLIPPTPLKKGGEQAALHPYCAKFPASLASDRSLGTKSPFLRGIKGDLFWARLEIKLFKQPLMWI
jgi:hypothetical protein